MRITARFKTALFMARKAGIKEISVTTGVKFGRTYFVVIPITRLNRFEIGTYFQVPEFGKPTSPTWQLTTPTRCRYMDIWKYINGLGKQEDMNLCKKP